MMPSEALGGAQRPYYPQVRHSIVAALLGLSLASQGAAQARVTGIVRDTLTARPLIGAIVHLRAPSGARSTRTDETGEFVFVRVPRGTYSLAVQRLGYAPLLRPIDVAPENSEPLLLSLTRTIELDTVRVRAAPQALYGAVGRTKDLMPIAHANIQVIGPSASGKVEVDSTGHFFVAIRTPGPYVVRASASAYEAMTVSVTVAPNDGVEVSLLLDSTTAAASHRLEQAFVHFQDRMNRRRLFAAMITRAELLKTDTDDMLTALRSSPSFAARSLRFGETACVFVDGRARVGVSLRGFKPEWMEAVELYSRSGEPTGTLQLAWPAGQPCGATGLPRVTPGPDVVTWVAFWLKR